MMRANRSFGDAIRHGLYRDREHGWLFGVCAGIAERFNLRRSAVRLLAAIGLLPFFWPSVLLYVLATVLIREKPSIYTGCASEHAFRRRRGDWRRS